MGERSRFTPISVKARYQGPRRSVAPLLALVDTEDPSFEFVAAVLKDMKAAGVELNEATIDIAVKIGRQKYSDEAGKRHATPERITIVYYIRRGDLIKIGTTVNPISRFKSLMPDEILAFEPGGTELEARRHREFSGARVARRGEYFRATDNLRAHMDGLRAKHGPPDPEWPTVSTLGRRYRRTRQSVVLPPLQSQEVATPTEAARLIGANRSTIQGWVHRGLIQKAGVNELGRPVYHLDHMRYLLERSRAWMNHQKHRATSVTDVTP